MRLASILVLIILGSCSNVQDQRKSVEDLHDIIMKENFQLNDMIDSIEMFESLVDPNSPNINEEALHSAKEGLAKSDLLMMKWMKDYGDSIDIIPNQKMSEYLQRQNIFLEKLKIQTFESIEDGRMVLDSLIKKNN